MPARANALQLQVVLDREQEIAKEAMKTGDKVSVPLPHLHRQMIYVDMASVTLS